MGPRKGIAREIRRLPTGSVTEVFNTLKNIAKSAAAGRWILFGPGSADDCRSLDFRTTS